MHITEILQDGPRLLTPASFFCIDCLGCFFTSCTTVIWTSNFLAFCSFVQVRGHKLTPFFKLFGTFVYCIFSILFLDCGGRQGVGARETGGQEGYGRREGRGREGEALTPLSPPSPSPPFELQRVTLYYYLNINAIQSGWGWAKYRDLSVVSRFIIIKIDN